MPINLNSLKNQNFKLAINVAKPSVMGFCFVLYSIENIFVTYFNSYFVNPL